MHYTAMTNHINNCPCHCQYCDTVAERDVISNQHMEKCHKLSVPCPNTNYTCGRDKTPQDEVDSRKRECVFYCEYFDTGMLVREKMPTNYRDEMATHIEYMHKVIRQLQKGNNLRLDYTEVVAEADLLENIKLDYCKRNNWLNYGLVLMKNVNAI